MRKPTLMAAQRRYRETRKQLSFLITEKELNSKPEKASYREIFIAGCKVLKAKVKAGTGGAAIKPTKTTQALREDLNQLRKALQSSITQKAFRYEKPKYDLIMGQLRKSIDAIVHIEAEIKELGKGS